MKTCPKCNVKILDDTDRCPLCRHALSGPDGGLRSYPDAVGSIRRARLFENMVLFLSVIAGIVALYLNYKLSHTNWWSLIVVLSLFYVNVVIRYAILGRSGYQSKVYGLLVIALLVLEGIDYLTGFEGWALTYVYPSGIMALDLAILTLMITNRRNWQSYMLPQLVLVVLSLLSGVFWLAGWNRSPLLAQISVGVALFTFLGTLILGDRRARNEMNRRFHV